MALESIKLKLEWGKYQDQAIPPEYLKRNTFNLADLERSFYAGLLVMHGEMLASLIEDPNPEQFMERMNLLNRELRSFCEAQIHE
jgi:hypothetical protein